MKHIAVALLATTFLLSACGEKKPAQAPSGTNQPAHPTTNQAASGNPITAPVDYLGAVNQAQKHAVKVADTVQIQQAIQQFHAAEDRYPKDLAELVKSGYLVRIPALPAGMKYQYNPANGQVRAAPAQ